MAKLPQVLLLDPSSELTFKGPFDESSTSDLRLTNPSARPVYFKVKTTALCCYSVRPNVGVIKPQQTVVINIMLQPVSQNALFEKESVRHRFMVQSAFGTDDDVAVDSFWKNVDHAQVMDSKLRVSFSQQNGSHTPKKTESEQSKFIPVTSLRAQDNEDRLALQREIELRKIYQDEKSRLERENHVLNEKLFQLSQVDQPMAGQVEDVDGFLLVHILLIGFIALCIGIYLSNIL